MPPLIQDGEFQAGIGNFLRCRHDAPEAFDRFVRPEDHPVALSGEVEEVGPVGAGLDQSIESGFSALNLETRSERATGVDESDEVLGMALDGLVEKLERLVEPIQAPKCSRA